MLLEVVEQLDPGLLDFLRSPESSRAVRAGAHNPVAHVLEQRVVAMFVLAQHAHPLRAGAVEDEGDLVSALLQLLRRIIAFTTRPSPSRVSVSASTRG
jgi:hypothetical protein